MSNVQTYELANSIPMLIICAVVVIVVLFQPFILSRMGMKQGLEIGLTKKEMHKAIKCSAIFAIIPSLPVLASYLVLVPALGKYFPWMRLSVVGSVAYETSIASSAAESYYPDVANLNIYTTAFEPGVFLGILFILTIGILGGNFFNLFFLKSYDKGIKKIVSKNEKLLPLITGAMFVGLFSVLSASTIATPILNLLNTPLATDGTINASSIRSGILAISAFFAAGFGSYALDKLAEKKPALKEHSFSISMILGMLVACIINPIFM